MNHKICKLQIFIYIYIYVYIYIYRYILYEIDLVEFLESAYPLDFAAVRCSCI